jgi:hypothetical protein
MEFKISQTPRILDSVLISLPDLDCRKLVFRTDLKFYYRYFYFSRALELPYDPDVRNLIAWNRFSALSKELEHTADDLQQLRINKGY